MTSFKPMLACPAPEDLTKIRYPVLVSPKLDGIRCVKLNGKALSRKLKPIPNDFVRNWVEANLPDGIDGELMLFGLPSAPFSEVSSAIMSKDGKPDFVFCAFDLLRQDDRSDYAKKQGPLPMEPFCDRLRNLDAIATGVAMVHGKDTRLRTVHHAEVTDVGALQSVMALSRVTGFEGVMIRDPSGPYKFGRSTEKEGYLMKLKNFADEEATVLGAIEEMENTNEATTNELGQTKRSTAKAGKVAKGRLGALKCRFEDGTEFEVGSGFTDKQRDEMWGLRLYGCVVKIKHQPPPGGRKPGEKPRFPVFLGFRHD